MKKKHLIGITTWAFWLLITSMTYATPYTSYQQGGVTLPDAPAYDWWYGCSPTSAGMMMGYYDINGYGNLSYENLVAGGTASPGYPGDINVRNTIASQGHIDHFYPGDMSANCGESGDDIPGRTTANFNSLADFMGTSQDLLGNSNGSTLFYNYTNGARFYASDALSSGVQDSSGMFGIMEYVNYAGYGLSSIFNQYVDTLGRTYGFSFNDYRNEIDNGRVVMIHVTGHSMFGYGYDDSDNILFRDTWDASEYSMAWGGSYSDMDMYGVTAFTFTGGDDPEIPKVPEPTTIILFGTGLAGLNAMRRKKKKIFVVSDV